MSIQPQASRRGFLGGLLATLAVGASGVSLVIPKAVEAAGPPGWLLCNGQAVSRAAYSELFAILGEACGAPDLETFNLPDLRGRVVIGVDSPAKPFSGTVYAINPRGTSVVPVGSVHPFFIPPQKEAA